MKSVANNSVRHVLQIRSAARINSVCKVNAQTETVGPCKTVPTDKFAKITDVWPAPATKIAPKGRSAKRACVKRDVETAKVAAQDKCVIRQPRNVQGA